MPTILRKVASIILLCAVIATPQSNGGLTATTDDGEWFVIENGDLAGGTHHTRHADIFGKYVTGYNRYILRSIDKVQATAMDGGGYFIGIHAEPAESPVGYRLQLLGRPLLEPPRSTSYCSGSTYAALIESMNLIFDQRTDTLTYDRYEALRMQEEDGGRREDTIKYWGKWNDDGFGSHYALVQYSGMGKEIKPRNARPGDFMNISWAKGGGHSVIFLGWYKNDTGQKHIVYWASQSRTNGFGDEVVPLDRIKEVKTVRLTEPAKLFSYDVTTPVERKIAGDVIDW